jgi:AcrR family transcriptional regulator
MAAPAAPRGEQAVRASLIATAAKLFAERGPRAVSVREVADAAGVNPGLVHHYFGSKGGLVTAVLDDLAEEAAEEIAKREPLDVFYAAGGATERHGRIVAHLLLEGADPTELKSGFPGFDALIERCRDEGMKPRDAKQRAAQVVALVLGWQLFEPYLTAAAGLPTTAKATRAALDDAVARLLRA